MSRLSIVSPLPNAVVVRKGGSVIEFTPHEAEVVAEAILRAAKAARTAYRTDFIRSISEEKKP